MKHALRQLRSNPGFTAIALVTLALGIGVNTTAFTVLERLLLQSLPFRDADTLVQIWPKTPRDGRDGFAPADYFDLKDQNSVFTEVAAAQPWQRMSFAEQGKAPIKVGAVYMTSNFCSVLGVTPELGRAPTQEESDKSAFVCLLSDRFWRDHFNADPKVLGQTVRVNSRPSTVIGVMPPAFGDSALFPNHPAFFYLDPVTHSRGVRQVGWYEAVARLKPGVSLEQAQAEMNVWGKRLATQYPDTNKDRTFDVIPYPKGPLGDDDAKLAWMTLALSGLVLLIACVNLANLQMVRTTRRSQEFAIRLSLGCPKHRLVGMILRECLVLSAIGGTLGIAVAAWSNAFVARFLDIDLPLNFRVVAFATGIAMITAVFFGVVPALLAFRGEVGDAIKSGGRGATSNRSRHWLRQGLVVVELAMALALLAGAGFFISGLYRLTHRDLGWDTEHEIIASVSLDQDHFGGDKNRDKVLAFGREVLTALRALPGVQSAAVSNGLPAWGSRMAPYQVEGTPPVAKGQEPAAAYFPAGPGLLDVYGLHLVAGRDFTEADGPDSAPVAIVNESMARKLWPGQSALGKRIANTQSQPLVWAEVVGVVRDFKGGGEFYNPEINNLRFMRPWAQDLAGPGEVQISVRTFGPPAPLKESVRRVIGVLLPDLALNELSTVEEDAALLVAYFNFLRRVLVEIAVLGLLLSAVGIYGVVANLAAERTKEIGIRMALGAEPGNILWMFVRNGVVLACAGAAIGLLGAFFLVTFLGRTLPLLPGKDPTVVALAAVALIAVAVLACWLPARRTTKVSPMIALRAE
ncbi:MAG TPA: ABC transporter permease [Candidatus Didemnitutus sp.]|nr:ABC transporter permease [Candidatus Didemnitutus sp.]